MKSFDDWLRDSGYFFKEPHTVHDKLRDAWDAAQQNVHPTALRVGLIAWFLGLGCGWFLFAVIFGGG